MAEPGYDNTIFNTQAQIEVILDAITGKANFSAIQMNRTASNTEYLNNKAGLSGFSKTVVGVVESECSNFDIVRWNGSALVPAQANSETSKAAVGVIYNISGGTGDLCTFGLLDGFSGLVSGDMYFISQEDFSPMNLRT